MGWCRREISGDRNKPVVYFLPAPVKLIELTVAKPFLDLVVDPQAVVLCCSRCWWQRMDFQKDSASCNFCGEHLEAQFIQGLGGTIIQNDEHFLTSLYHFLWRHVIRISGECHSFFSQLYRLLEPVEDTSLANAKRPRCCVTSGNGMDDGKKMAQIKPSIENLVC